MANELQLTMRMIVNNLVNTRRDIKPAIQQVDWGNNVIYDNVITLSTSNLQLPMPDDMTTIGWCIFHNLDDTNNIQYGTNQTTELFFFGLLLPGEYGMLRLDPQLFVTYTGVTAIASAGTPQLEYTILAET